MKYIKHKVLGYILFQDTLQHCDVAEKFGGRKQVDSAGFVAALGGTVHVFGESMTLDIQSHPGDIQGITSALKC